MVVTGTGFGGREDLFSLPSVLLTSCVTLSKLLNLSEHHLAISQTGMVVHRLWHMILKGSSY